MERGSRTFEIAHCLGRGGFGEVYRATLRTQGGLESEIALKVLRRDLDPSGQAVQRLRDEGRLLARLDHPVILRVHDLAVLDGRVGLITEYIAGEDLESLLKGDDRIGTRALLEVIAKVAHALDAAWNAPLRDGTPLRIVHRDIKPSNLRIGRHGEVKLLDFGIAKTDALQREARTQTDMMVGSPAYMAPERFRNNELHPASDVFALGATLLEGLTKRRFYGRMELPRIAGLALDRAAFAEHVADQLGRLPEGTSPELRALLAATLDPSVEARIRARELAERAELLAETAEGPPLARWCRARSWREESKEVAELSGRTLSETSFSVAPAAARSVPPPTYRGASSTTVESPPPSTPSLPPVAVPVRVRSGPSPALVVGLVAIVLVAGIAGLATAGIGTFAVGSYLRPGAATTGAAEVDGEPATGAPVDGSDGEPATGEAVGSPGEPAAGETVGDGSNGEAGRDEPAADDPIEEAASERTPLREGDPQATPPPRPRAPEPVPATAPGPIAAPLPSPAPSPEPAGAIDLARVAVFGLEGQPATAHGDSGVVDLPNRLPPGRWSFQVDFGAGAVVARPGEVTLQPGESWELRCNPRMAGCEIKRP